MQVPLQSPVRSMSSLSSAYSPQGQRRNTVGSASHLSSASASTFHPGLPKTSSESVVTRVPTSYSNPLKPLASDSSRPSTTRSSLQSQSLRLGPRRMSANLIQPAYSSTHNVPSLLQADGQNLFGRRPSVASLASRSSRPTSPGLATVKEHRQHTPSISTPYISSATSEYWEPSDTESAHDVPEVFANLACPANVEPQKLAPIDIESSQCLPDSFNLTLSPAVAENIASMADESVQESSPNRTQSPWRSPASGVTSIDGSRRTPIDSPLLRQSPALARHGAPPIYGSEWSPSTQKVGQAESPSFRERARSSILSMSLGDSESARPSFIQNEDTKIQDGNESTIDNMIPPDLLEVATNAARVALDAEIQGRLSALKATTAKVASREMQEELKSLATSQERCQATQPSSVSCTDELVARLRSQLRDVSSRTQRLWTAAQTQDQSSQGNASPSHTSDQAEMRGEACRVEKEIEQSKEQAQASQTNARQLDACNGRLQKELQSARSLLQERKREAAASSVEACQKLKLAAGQLEIEALRAAEATKELCSQRERLQGEAERLQADRDEALLQLRKQEDADSAQWNRLAALVCLRESRQTSRSSVIDLSAMIRKDWADARNQRQEKEIERRQCQQRIKELENELAIARETAQRSSSQRHAAVVELETTEREKRALERRAREELASAQAERVMLSEHRIEWEKTRPQLSALIEELRVGRVASTGATRSLSDRLAALRCIVEAKRTKVASAATPGKSPSPCVDNNSNTGSPDRCANGSGVGTDIGSPIAQVSCDKLFSPVDSSSDSPTKFRLPPNELEDSRDDDDPLVRKAAEENQVLHKKVLELEEEKAVLVRSQEELIAFIKDRVEPVQRALGLH